MSRHFVLAFVLAMSVATASTAQTAQEILTSKTKAYISIPDVREFEANWAETLMGQLAADPIMQPFTKDMQMQIRDRLIQSNLNIQVDWEQIQNACGKELCVATVLPTSGEGQAAVLIMDISGREQQAEEMKKAFSKKLAERNAKRSTVEVSGQTLIVHQLPRQRGMLNAEAVAEFTFGNHLVITNHVKVSEELLVRMVTKNFDESLQSLEAFDRTVRRCEREDETLTPHIQWFIEPFGFVRLLKSSQLEIGSNKHDYLTMFAEQGFDAVHAVGGVMHFATGKHEMLHRTFVFAPAEEGAEPGEKFKLAARMLDFPNDNNWAVPSWIPRDLATHVSIRWKTAEAFEHVGSFVDAMAGQTNYFGRVLVQPERRSEWSATRHP